MFCPKCGTQMADGAKFCPKCGASMQADQPAQQPAQQQPVQQQAQPVQQPMQQPVQQQGWQQPMQQPMQQQGWQQQPMQQQGWQQPMQQPMQQQGWQQQPMQQPMQQQGWQQQPMQQPMQQQGWQQNTWQQSTAYGAAPYGMPMRAAKKFPFMTVLITLAVVAGGLFAAVKFTPLQAVYMKHFAAPEKYYQYVEEDSVEELAASVSTVYDNLVASNVAAENNGMSGTISVELGDEARSLVRDLAGSYLDQLNPGDDLSWLKTLAIDYDISRDGDLLGLNGKLALNGTSIVSVNGVADTAAGKAWVSVPELSDRYIELDLNEMGLEDLNLSGGLNSALRSILRSVPSVDADQISPMLEALPEADVLEKLISKYLEAVVNCCNNVEKGSGSLSVAGVSEDYTALTITIDGSTIEKIVKTVGPELKTDSDVKDIVLKMAEAAGEDGQKTYDEFVSGIDQILENTDMISDSFDQKIVMRVYVDGKGDAHGRSIEFGENVIEILMPEKGGKFGLRVAFVEDGTEHMLLLGSGTRSGDKLTGSMDLEIEGQYVGKVGLEGFDDKKLKEGYLVGGVTVTPSSELLKQLGDMPSTLSSILENLTLRVDMDTAQSSAHLGLTLLTGDRMLISAALDLADTSGGSVRSVGSGVAPDVWVKEDVTLDKLEKIVRSIEGAGVPKAYVDLLDQLLDSAF